MKKEEKPEIIPTQPEALTVTPKKDEPMPLISMILGIVSLMGPGLLLGIPAIVLGIIALKNTAENKALSITGLVTGIVSTVVSLLVIGVFIFVVNSGVEHMPEWQEYRKEMPHGEAFFEGTRT